VNVGAASGVQNVSLTDADIVNLANLSASGQTTTGLATTTSYGPSVAPPFMVAPYPSMNGILDCDAFQYTLSPGQSCGISIYFQPTTAGTFSQTTYYDDNGYSGVNGYVAAQTIQLSGTGASVVSQADRLLLSAV
jgi:hypothetical protein